MPTSVGKFIHTYYDTWFRYFIDYRIYPHICLIFLLHFFQSTTKHLFSRVLFLDIGCPCKQILSHSNNDEENRNSLRDAHFSHSTVIIEGWLPVGQTITKYFIVLFSFWRVLKNVIDRYEIPKLNVRIFGFIFIGM